MEYDLRNKFALKTYLAEIAEDNYFNDLHQIIRVKFNGRYFDFRYRTNVIMPNPDLHLAILSATEEQMAGPGLSTDDQARLPGLDQSNNPVSLAYGWVDVINKKQMTMVTNPQNGSSAFAVEGSDMSNKNKTRIALTAPLKKDYTNLEGNLQSSPTGEASDSSEDTGDLSIGVFINDDSVVIKSPGGQITMGKEGVHIGGSLKLQSSEHEREWMFDNTLARFIPSTIPTGAAVIPELPNVAKFAKYGQVAQRVIKVADITSTAIGIFT